MVRRIILHIRSIILLIFIGSFLAGSSEIQRLSDQSAREYTRRYEFNFVYWTTETIFEKIILGSLNPSEYLSIEAHKKVIEKYLSNSRSLNEIKNEIQLVFSNPYEIDSEKKYSELEIKNELFKKTDYLIKPIVEEILKTQIISVYFENQIAITGRLFPPLLFKISELPSNLIISPRERIEQIESISLISQLEINEIENLETKVDSEVGVSSLVVPIGGLGTYPTMIASSSSLQWMINTIVHEWIHNWLAFKPLGWNYGISSELRTMNETTASIVGGEIELMVLEKYYPNIYNDIILSENELRVERGENTSYENSFIFSDEMYKTRNQVDLLLSRGNISEAETYMEARRQYFWDNGYHIRKVNQAYFAFYGAYADSPGGATGTDPVGPAVRKLREQSKSLSEFLFSIASLSSFDELIQIIE